MESSLKARALPVFWLLLAVLAPVGCGVEANSERELTVFAASSLTDVFEELGKEFERQNPGVEVRLSFAGSSGLLAQLQQGAPADVFASADEAKMRVAAGKDLIQQPQVFAENSPVVIVPKGEPTGVETIRDLAEQEHTLVLAQNGVPIAEYAAEVLEKAEARYGENFGDLVMQNVVSREPDVRAAANRVALGEADATFVYASDVTPKVRDRVDVVGIPEELNVVATYPIAVVKDAPNPELARKWVELVTHDQGQRVMREWGFERAR